MRRTQIYLDAELSQALDRLARKKGTSRAHLIRQAARQLLEREGVRAHDPLFDIVGMGDSGDSGGSADHDRILAGAEFRSWSE